MTTVESMKCKRCGKSLATKSSVARESISKETGEPVCAEDQIAV